MKRFVWFVLGVMLMSLPAPVGATSLYPFYNYETKTEFGRVFFASGSTELDDAAKRVLDRQFRVVVSFPTDYGIIIYGHTDHKEVPGGQESLVLGEERAQAVKNYFISKGIAAKRIDIMSYGWYRPAVPTSGDWSKNRRTVTIDRLLQ